MYDKIKFWVSFPFRFILTLIIVIVFTPFIIASNVDRDNIAVNIMEFGLFYFDDIDKHIICYIIIFFLIGLCVVDTMYVYNILHK